MNVSTLFILGLVLLGSAGCIAVPAEVRAEFSEADGTRPNNFHACPICARAAKAGTLKPGAPLPCAVPAR